MTKEDEDEAALFAYWTHYLHPMVVAGDWSDPFDAKLRDLLALAQAKGGGKDLGDEPYDSQPATPEPWAVLSDIEGLLRTALGAAQEALANDPDAPPSPPSPSPWPSEEGK